jgi:hypothetical protein
MLPHAAYAEGVGGWRCAVATLGEALAEAHRIAWEDPGPEWFAPVRPTIEALGAVTAARPPGPGLNPPWRVLSHLRTGYALWARWLAGEVADPAGFGAGEEWTPVADPSPAAWEALVAEAIADEARLRAVIAGMPDERLLAVEPRFAETPLALVLSFIAHTGYHAGELATLASLTRPGSSS